MDSTADRAAMAITVQVSPPVSVSDSVLMPPPSLQSTQQRARVTTSGSPRQLSAAVAQSTSSDRQITPHTHTVPDLSELKVSAASVNGGSVSANGFTLALNGVPMEEVEPKSPVRRSNVSGAQPMQVDEVKDSAPSDAGTGSDTSASTAAAVARPRVTTAEVAGAPDSTSGPAIAPQPKILPGAVPVRKKVPMEQGYSGQSWMALSQSLPRSAPRRISLAEVAKHNKREDCWIALRGRVYDITRYARYHPGGVDMILKAAGRDGTSLFDKYHPWVNFEFLLGNCWVGVLA